ncbi:homologous-pairing protein 2 homolog [Nephila pilipes]|uniref:Homologous-pairing protein 2 homolog n=1 Tax=Nephila pilipes TaxID=299642 RepID=A0A8X6TGJ7_NEPPI|nr:homologous-pairing protein 2 homolog [Nephila pilipes]
MSKSNINKQILDYLKDQNRPYSVIDIHNNLHKEHGKTAVMKALEILVNDGKVKEKTYGKQKIYFVDQNEFANSDNADLMRMDAEINNMTNTLNDLQKQIKVAESQLDAIDKSLTTEEAELELEKIKNELPQLRLKLESLESNTGRISPEEKNALYEARKKYCKEWQKRKRLANDMLDAILEGYPKTKKHLFEEVGMETDGDLKVFTF